MFLVRSIELFSSKWSLENVSRRQGFFQKIAFWPLKKFYHHVEKLINSFVRFIKIKFYKKKLCYIRILMCQWQNGSTRFENSSTMQQATWSEMQYELLSTYLKKVFSLLSLSFAKWSSLWRLGQDFLQRRKNFLNMYFIVGTRQRK